MGERVDFKDFKDTVAIIKKDILTLIEEKSKTKKTTDMSAERNGMFLTAHLIIRF